MKIGDIAFTNLSLLGTDEVRRISASPNIPRLSADADAILFARAWEENLPPLDTHGPLVSDKDSETG